MRCMNLEVPVDQIRSMIWHFRCTGSVGFSPTHDSTDTRQADASSDLVTAHVPPSTGHDVQDAAHPIDPIVGLVQLLDHRNQCCIPLSALTGRPGFGSPVPA